jgi:formate hydrogenlyase subunit 3/multisubunit Na+/H+ antiporter MnhD subunit
VSALDLVFGALFLLVCTAPLGLVLARSGRAVSLVAPLGSAAACLMGLVGALWALSPEQASELRAAWAIPGGALVVGIDALSAFFLVPLFALGALVALYGRAYLAAPDGGVRAPAASASLSLLIASMVLVLIARHALLFLVAWETMALLAYLLVSTDHAQAEVRRAGWTFLIASHVGVLALIGLFLGLSDPVGGALDFASFERMSDLSQGAALALLGLALVGFGIKAGVPGLHVWLPEAHAAAPSHVSALMSGVLVKLGVYGLLRVLPLLPVQRVAGAALMALGLAGALGGIALALQQRDLKRVLAYSTIENVGIVLFGLGLGWLARSRGDAVLAALGLAGGLLHVWNHCAIKGLLFLGAGSALHATGTRDLEQLGGLLRHMPVTGISTLLGAVAIAGLPPLNGLIGEWLIYRGLAAAALDTSSLASLAPMAAIAAFALVGGLATLCFVRLAGVALLGEPRSEAARHAHESSRGMTGPLALLAVGCLALSFLSPLAAGAVAPLVNGLGGIEGAEAPVRAALAPLASFNLGLAGLILVGALLLAPRVRAAASDETWACGYAAPAARMQYTASSFAELIAHRLLPAWLRSRPERDAPRGLFPERAAWAARHEDPLTRSVYEPFLVRWGDRFARLRWLQQGRLHVYLVYIAGMAVIGLLWSSLRGWWSS